MEKSAMEREARFRQLLLESIDEGICGVLGEGSRQAVFYHVENRFQVRREKIPEDLENFQNGLAKIFGSGARVLARVIARRLCEKLEIPFSWRNDYDFKTYVEDCKLRYEEKQRG